MIKVRLHEDIEGTMFSCGTRFGMQREIDYVMEAQSLSTIAALVDGNISAEPITIAKRFGETPSSILIVRAGAAGDILFLTPILAQLRRQYPSAHIGVAISTRYHWVLRGNKNVDGYSDIPLKLGLVGRYDWVIDLENAVENNHAAHVVDLFAEKSHVKLEDRHTTYYTHTPFDEFDAECRKTKKRVGIQLAASTPVRTYPRVLELQNKLREAGWEVAVFSEPGQLKFPNPIENLINVGSKNWTWQKSTDFLKTCDFVIGPDSSLIHFAGAMGVPGIGLYGSFAAKYRLIEGGSIQAIQATAECPFAPCFHHGRRFQILPVNGPCNAARVCTTLATITPESILEKMASMGF